MDSHPAKRTALDFLFRVEAPWIHIGPAEAARRRWIPSFFYSRPGLDVCVRRLRGNKMRTTQALMDEFAASFQFFDGFGENWWALQDCLECLDEWLPAEAYVVVVERADDVLADEGLEAMSALMRTLKEVAESWSKPIEDNGRFNRSAIPFHVLMNVADGATAVEQRIAQAVEEAGVSAAVAVHRGV